MILEGGIPFFLFAVVVVNSKLGLPFTVDVFLGVKLDWVDFAPTQPSPKHEDFEKHFQPRGPKYLCGFIIGGMSS